MRPSSPATRSQKSSTTQDANRKFNRNAIQGLTSKKLVVMLPRSRMKFRRATRKKSRNSSKSSLKIGFLRERVGKLNYYCVTMVPITLKSRQTTASSYATTPSMTLFGNTMALAKTLSSISTLTEKVSNPHVIPHSIWLLKKVLKKVQQE